MMTLDHSRVAFLNELTHRHEHFLVWKHLDRALQGRGDIDAAAPDGEIAAIAADAVSIAADTLGASHVIHCHHVADKRLQFFIQPERLPQLFEFDLCMQPSRGLAPWAAPRAMLALATIRPDGIRSLRPGAEAVVSLVYHGLSPSGRDRLAGDEREIVDSGIAADLVGAEEACATLPPRPARRLLRELVMVLAAGGWDSTRARLAFSAFLGSTLAHPVFCARRVRFRATLAGGGECVMSRLARHHGRRVPPTGLDRLLDEARAGGHEMVAVTGRS